MTVKPITTPVEVPEEFPEYGELDGERVNLREAAKSQPRATMTRVTVEMPDGRKIRPWKDVALYEGDTGF